MLTVLPKKRIVTRILTAPTGELVRAYVLLTEFEGQTFWRVIKVEKVDEPVLPAPKVKCNFQFSIFNFQERESPYFSKLDTFFISQMTRAPSEAA